MSNYYSELRKARRMIDTAFIGIEANNQELDREKLIYELGLKCEIGDKAIVKMVDTAIRVYGLKLEDGVIMVGA